MILHCFESGASDSEQTQWYISMTRRYQGKPAFVHAAPGQSFTEAALNIAAALEGERFDSLSEQVL